MGSRSKPIASYEDIQAVRENKHRVMVWDYDDLFERFIKTYRDNFQLRWADLVVEYRSGGYAVLKDRINGKTYYIYDPVNKSGEFKCELSREVNEVLYHILQTPPVEVKYDDADSTE